MRIMNFGLYVVRVSFSVGVVRKGKRNGGSIASKRGSKQGKSYNK